MDVVRYRFIYVHAVLANLGERIEVYEPMMRKLTELKTYVLFLPLQYGYLGLSAGLCLQGEVAEHQFLYWLELCDAVLCVGTGTPSEQNRAVMSMAQKLQMKIFHSVEELDKANAA